MFKHKIYFSREKTGLGCLNARVFISRAVRAALDVEGITEPCEVSVLLTDDEGIHALNKQFRQVDRATDVLSFPANNFVPGAFDPAIAERNPKTGRIMLGDMALSIEHARAQGEEFGHGTKREIQYLTAHSMLHLLGYDHMDEGEQKRQMREREKDIMARLEGVREE